MERHYKLKQATSQHNLKMENENDYTPKEMGLIKHLSRRNHQLKASRKDVKDLYTNALKMIYELGGDVFEYAIKTEIEGKAYAMSVIGDYTNKKGIISKVHYNKNGYFIGSVKKLGDEPIPALYQTKICKELFVYNPIENNFIPKEVETPKEETKPKKLKKRRLVIVERK